MKNENLPDHFVIDDCLWEKLRDSDPDVICRNCKISFNSKERCYIVPVLNERYGISPWEEKIVRISDLNNNISTKEIELSLFLLHYLLGAKDIELRDDLVSEKDIKGGEMFFRGPHSLPVKRIIEKYGRDPNGFVSTGVKLGGIKVDFGDSAIELKAAPKIPITYVLWAEDEEFPASAKVLFDSTIREFLPLDIIYGITVFVYKSLI